MVDIVGNETLASLWDKLARECGDKDFFIFQDREGNVATYSYRAFNELIDQTANMFGDRRPSNFVRTSSRRAVPDCAPERFLG